METNDQTSNKPVSKVCVGPVEASIWENAGENGPRCAVTFDRRYRDDCGNRKNARKLGKVKYADRGWRSPTSSAGACRRFG
jgi:hypothetical protein